MQGFGAIIASKIGFSPFFPHTTAIIYNLSILYMVFFGLSRTNRKNHRAFFRPSGNAFRLFTERNIPAREILLQAEKVGLVDGAVPICDRRRPNDLHLSACEMLLQTQQVKLADGIVA